MKRQGGFTLIELVVVIVILGILAVTAAPKFLNMQDDARKASLEGLKGAISGAAGIVYGKSAIKGVESKSGEAISGAFGTSIAVEYGFPAATSAALAAAVDGLATDWDAYTTGLTDEIRYSFKANTQWGDATVSDVTKACMVQYKEASDSSAATTKVYSDGC